MSDRAILGNLNNLLNALDKFGPGDISLVNKRVRDWNKRMQFEAASKFVPGDKVFFYSKRNGKVTGTIIAINHKRIKLQEAHHGMIWRVSPSLLEKEEKKDAK